MHALKRLQFRDKNSNWYFSAVLISLFVVSVHLHGDCRFAPVEPAALDVGGLFFLMHSAFNQRTRHQHHQHQHRRRRRPWHRHVLTGRILSLRVPIKQLADRQRQQQPPIHLVHPCARLSVVHVDCARHIQNGKARERERWLEDGGCAAGSTHPSTHARAPGSRIRLRLSSSQALSACKLSAKKWLGASEEASQDFEKIWLVGRGRAGGHWHHHVMWRGDGNVGLVQFGLI
ncbi:hypothetical protein IWZ00DRAFT_195652 [Phyllosticta capitalensis]